MPMVNVAESPFHYILAITDDWSELTVDIDDYEIPHLIIPKSVDGKVPHIIYIAGTVAARSNFSLVTCFRSWTA